MKADAQIYSDAAEARANLANTERPMVLVLADWYLPGYRAGGPIRSIAHCVAQLNDRFRFRILTLDRDLGDREPYPSIVPNQWIGNRTEIMYLRPGIGSYLRTLKLLWSMNEDTIVYLNSFFSRRSSMLPVWARWMGICRATKFIVAPRGEFSPGALGINPLRKRFYIAAARFLQLYKKVIWQASSEFEAHDIRAQFGAAEARRTTGDGRRQHAGNFKRRSAIVVAPDLLCTPPPIDSRKKPKCPGSLRIAFISRITLMKNLDFALRRLHAISGDVVFDIYGPIEDQKYWEECQQIIRRLPPNVRVCQFGEVPHEQVVRILLDHDLMFLPTRGENFGHIIFESLSAGCPVLLSDRTPWRALERDGVGWDIPLDDTKRFERVLQECIDMDELPFKQKSERAMIYALEKSVNPESVGAHQGLFERVFSEEEE
jgi:glycosyltransferase involved in cell wall biosynthesis